MSLLVDSSKIQKALVAATGLAKTKVIKTLYCWSCGYAGHIKKDFLSKKKEAHTMNNAKRKLVFPAKNLTKEISKHLLKK